MPRRRQRIYCSLVAILTLFLASCTGSGHKSAVSPGATSSPGTSSRSASASAASSASEPSGAATTPIPRSTDQAWIENFDGPAGTPPDPTLFDHQLGGDGWGNGQLQTYTDDAQNAALNGHSDLVIKARRESRTGPDGITRNWTSARLITNGHWSFTYGTLAARLKVPAGIGMWPAFWLVGDDLPSVGWPDAGEIDVLETVDEASVAHQTLHGPRVDGTPWQLGRAQSASAGRSYADAFHVYAVQRLPNRITLSIDGVTVSTATPANLGVGERWVFEKPMFVLFNVAVGGSWPERPTRRTPSQNAMFVDWLSYTPPRK